MRITIQALVEGAEGEEPCAETIGVVEREADGALTSGLGLFLRETHAILQNMQAVVLREQVAQFVDRAGRCRQCGCRLATKGSKTVVYRTASVARCTTDTMASAKLGKPALQKSGPRESLLLLGDGFLFLCRLVEPAPVHHPFERAPDEEQGQHDRQCHAGNLPRSHPADDAECCRDPD